MKLSSIVAGGLVAGGCASGYRISLYSEYGYGGRQATYTTNGAHRVGFTTKSWIWESSLGDGCCIVFCRGSTNVGRFCGSARRRESSAGVNKVVTGCGRTTLNC